MHAVLVLQALPETPAGWVGWASALTSGAILYWLLFWHIPAKDKWIETIIATKDAQLREEISRSDKRMDAMATVFKAEMESSRSEFKDSLDAILSHCKDETGKMMEAVRTELRLARDNRKN